MEKIKISNSERRYEIRSIFPHSKTVLKIVFPEDGKVPASWGGDILIYTAGGIPCSTLHGYETVYLQEDRTVYLSNDGSVYVPPAPPEPVPEPEPYVPTLEEVKAAKKAQISAACEQIIYAGIYVMLSDGQTYHFSLTMKDQINLFVRKQNEIAAGAEMIEYHADGNSFRYYSAIDMENIIGSATWHISHHTAYCNALNMWIAGCQTKDEVREIYYGADVPEEYRSEVLNTYLVQIAEMAAGNEGSEEAL